MLSNALNYAVRVGAIQSSPWRAITLPKTEAKAVEIISKTEEEAYIAAVRRWCTGLDPNQEDDEEPAGRSGRGGGLTNIMRVIAGSGVRTSEALGLRIQDVDPKARRITVCGQSTARGTRTPVLKNRTSRFSHRVISITQDAADAIQEQLEDDAVQFWGEPLFPSRNGTYRTANNLNRDLRDATERLREDLKHDIVPKNFRTTVGTRIRDKYGVDAAQLHLGHATNAVTQKYYLAAPEEIADYMSGLE
ncbi:tyrosine recombinase XerC [Corynebacterium sp. 045007]|uniref:site-specific integrase n=1 Tax=Corynebacterium sp. 045007 TaxID=3156078 RepID=UPI00345BB3D1